MRLDWVQSVKWGKYNQSWTSAWRIWQRHDGNAIGTFFLACPKKWFRAVSCLLFFIHVISIFAALSATLNVSSNACDDDDEQRKEKRVKWNNNDFSILFLLVALHLPFSHFKIVHIFIYVSGQIEPMKQCFIL